MSDEMFSLKWNGHQSTFFDILATAREKKTFCDATIACEGNFYPVHRFVISTCSTYFESILEDVIDTHPVIVLADVASKDIEDLLQYMYTGEVKVLQEDIESLIKAGEGLKIKGLGVADEGVADDCVADEVEKPKKKKRIINGDEGRPEKRQRTDEIGNRSKLKQSSRELEKKEAESSFVDCNEDANQNEADGSFEDSDQPMIEEVSPVKEELLEPCEDSLYFPETSIKEEFNDSLMEEDVTSADGEQFERSSDIVIRQDYDNVKKKSFTDASTSRTMSPGQKLHMDWIAKNEVKSRSSGNQRAPLTGFCLVCGDNATGYHYGIETCEGCKAFFKRSTRNSSGMGYVCKYNNECDIVRGSRGACKSCRFKKCLLAGMKVDNIRPDRSRGGSHKRSESYSYNFTKTPSTPMGIGMIPYDYDENNEEGDLSNLEISGVTSNYEDFE